MLLICTCNCLLSWAFVFGHLCLLPPMQLLCETQLQNISECIGKVWIIQWVSKSLNIYHVLSCRIRWRFRKDSGRSVNRWESGDGVHGKSPERPSRRVDPLPSQPRVNFTHGHTKSFLCLNDSVFVFFLGHVILY